MPPTSMPVTGNTERTMPENRAFYPALDGLRAVAFLLVFFQHYYSLPWGWAGVNIFFVLSGFLITGILFDSRNDAHRVRNFYIRRTLRIFPLYYGVFLAILLLDPIFHWRWSLSWLAWPFYLGNVLRFASPAASIYGSSLQLAAFAWLRTPLAPRITLYLGHFWSLCLEEQFYLFWPWVVFLVRSRRSLSWICGSTVIVVPLLRVVAQHMAPPWMIQGELLYRAIPFQLDALLLGGLIALLWRGPHRKRLFEIGVIIVLYATFLATFVLLVGILHSYPNWRVGYRYPSWTETWGFTFINLFAAGIIICALRPGPIYRLLSVRPLRWVGRISYGAYVFHNMFNDIYRHIVAVISVHNRFVANHADPAVLLLGLTCTLLLSWLSFRFFESKFLNLKERWTAKHDEPLLTAVTRIEVANQ